MPRYEPLDHTADTGVIAYGQDLPELFANAAFGLFDLMFGLRGLEPDDERSLEVEGDGLEEVMVAWLEELLFELEAHERAAVSYDVIEVDEQGLRARIGTRPVDDLELVGPPVKAVTYHDLGIERTADGWRARVIFDV